MSLDDVPKNVTLRRKNKIINVQFIFNSDGLFLISFWYLIYLQMRFAKGFQLHF